MADVQLENGYTAIANDLLTAFSNINLSSHEFRVLWTLIRLTYGFKRKTVRIKGSNIVKETGLCRQNVWRALSKLESRKIIDKHKGFLGIHKNFDDWKANLSKSQEKILNKVHKEEKKQKANYPQEIREIFKFWNMQHIRTHGRIKVEMVDAINDALKDYTLEEILQSIENYSKILVSKKHYYTVSYTLAGFILRGMDNFMIWEECNYAFLNYKDQKKVNSLNEQKTEYKKYKPEAEIGSFN